MTDTSTITTEEAASELTAAEQELNDIHTHVTSLYGDAISRKAYIDADNFAAVIYFLDTAQPITEATVEELHNFRNRLMRDYVDNTTADVSETVTGPTIVDDILDLVGN